MSEKKTPPPLKPLALINFKKTDDELAKIIGEKNKDVTTGYAPAKSQNQTKGE